MIPDANFEAELIAQGIDADNTINGQVLTANIANLTSLDVTNKGIVDLTGIEDFTSLNTLTAAQNSLVSVDLSNITSLASFNGSGNTTLSTLTLGNKPNLQSLSLVSTGLATVDISQAPVLATLLLNGSTSLNSLDLSNKPNLENLNLASTAIASLNVAGASDLSSIDLSNTAQLSGNLDLSVLANLQILVINNSQLTTLNIKNGTNANISVLDVRSNSNLACIQVDDPNNIPAGWSKDATASYSLSCVPGVQITNLNPTITIAGQNTIDIVFSEPVNGFDSSGIQVTNATLSNFTGAQGSASYSVVVDIAQNVVCDGLTVEITVPAGSATGVGSGQQNTAGTASGVGADLIAPTIILAQPLLTLDANGQFSLTKADADGGTTDNCTASADLVFTFSQTNFDCNDIGTNTVDVTVTDVIGNAATQPMTFLLADASPPVIVTQDITVQLDANGQASITPADIDSGTTDNCAITS